jgi:hypothetical protein
VIVSSVVPAKTLRSQTRKKKRKVLWLEAEAGCGNRLSKPRSIEQIDWRMLRQSRALGCPAIVVDFGTG